MIQGILTFIFTGLLFGAQIDRELPGDFEVKTETDSVILSYKWRKPGWFSKDTTPNLVLRIKNMNPHKVLVRFHVVYYWRTIRTASTRRIEFCIKPGNTIRGRMWGLVFPSAGFTEAQLNDRLFAWKISDLEILHSADCKNRLRIMMHPEIQNMNGP